MYKIKLTTRAERELGKISKIHKQAIAECLEDLKTDPNSGKPLTRELTKKLSFRVGVYRIIYKINHQDKVVTVLTAGHRSTVYG